MKYQKHWVENLQVGDRLLICLRHPTDGSFNRHNVPAIFVSSDSISRIAKVSVDNEVIEIPFNEAKQIDNTQNPQQ